MPIVNGVPLTRRQHEVYHYLVEHMQTVTGWVSLTDICPRHDRTVARNLIKRGSLAKVGIECADGMLRVKQ